MSNQGKWIIHLEYLLIRYHGRFELSARNELSARGIDLTKLCNSKYLQNRFLKTMKIINY